MPNAEEMDTVFEGWAKGMNPRDIMFVRAFLTNFQAKQAAMAIGYQGQSANANGYRMIRRPRILKAVAEAMAERAKLLGISSETVLADAYQAFHICMQEKNYSAARGFLEMVGKHVNVQAFAAKYTPKADQANDDDAMLERLAHLSDEELEQIERASRIIEGPEPPKRTFN